MNFRRWIKIFMFEAVIALVLSISLVIIIDPFFHFHKPLRSIYYSLEGGYERYQNDGIIRHFNYDAVITGTSMTENFKTSEAEKVFGDKVIKVPFSGGTFKEINDNLSRAFKYNENIKYIIRSLDYTHIIEEDSSMRNDLGRFPYYLYNNEYSDDIFYILNKDAVKFSILCIKNTIKKGSGITSFDEYANWNDDYIFGANSVLGIKDKYVFSNKKESLDVKDIDNLHRNVYQNVVKLAEEHPDTIFYYFFPPYSMAYYGHLIEEGKLESALEAEEMTIELILQQPNIRLFSFNLNRDLVTDLNNYKDTTHYGEWVNSQILEWMKNDVGRITKDNYKEYLHNEREFLMNYDYNQLFNQKMSN